MCPVSVKRSRSDFRAKSMLDDPHQNYKKIRLIKVQNPPKTCVRAKNAQGNVCGTPCICLLCIYLSLPTAGIFSTFSRQWRRSIYLSSLCCIQVRRAGAQMQDVGYTKQITWYYTLIFRILWFNHSIHICTYTQFLMHNMSFCIPLLFNSLSTHTYVMSKLLSVAF